MSGFTTASAYQKHVHNFDIDNYLNRVVPRNRLDLLPRRISHWFGYRPANAKAQGTWAAPVYWLSALIGGFVGIAIITNVFAALPLLGGHQVPIVIASFGAAAILEYNTIDSPLAQPRNLIVGHVISAVIGVGITKGFERLPPERFEPLRWLAGSISVGVASAAMSITKTVHPPAGATALLAATSADITVLGWWLVPLILLASTLMTASALVINNIARQWPMYWWTPADRSKTPTKDVEDGASDSVGNLSESEFDSTTEFKQRPHTDQSSEPTLAQRADSDELHVRLSKDKIMLPEWWEPTRWETEVLEILQQKLQQRPCRRSTNASAPYAGAKGG